MSDRMRKLAFYLNFTLSLAMCWFFLDMVRKGEVVMAVLEFLGAVLLAVNVYSLRPWKRIEGEDDNGR